MAATAPTAGATSARPSAPGRRAAGRRPMGHGWRTCRRPRRARRRRRRQRRRGGPDLGGLHVATLADHVKYLIRKSTPEGRSRGGGRARGRAARMWPSRRRGAARRPVLVPRPPGHGPARPAQPYRLGCRLPRRSVAGAAAAGRRGCSVVRRGRGRAGDGTVRLSGRGCGGAVRWPGAVPTAAGPGAGGDRGRPAVVLAAVAPGQVGGGIDRLLSAVLPGRWQRSWAPGPSPRCQRLR